MGRWPLAGGTGEQGRGEQAAGTGGGKFNRLERRLVPWGSGERERGVGDGDGDGKKKSLKAKPRSGSPLGGRRAERGFGSLAPVRETRTVSG